MNLFNKKPLDNNHMISIPSICIPRINKNIRISQIINTFEKILGPNCIKNIEFKNLNNYNNKVFIYFLSIEKRENALFIMNRLNKNEDFKIVSNNEIWKCYKYIPKNKYRKLN